jgi:hypothetical protein
MSQRTQRVHDLMSGAWAAVEKGNWSEPVLGVQKAFIFSFEAVAELTREVDLLASKLDELESKIDRGYKLANAVKGYLGIVGVTRELTGWEAELKKVLTTFEGPEGSIP